MSQQDKLGQIRDVEQKVKHNIMYLYDMAKEVYDGICADQASMPRLMQEIAEYEGKKSISEAELIRWVCDQCAYMGGLPKEDVGHAYAVYAMIWHGITLDDITVSVYWDDEKDEITAIDINTPDWLPDNDNSTVQEMIKKNPGKGATITESNLGTVRERKPKTGR